MDNHLILRTLSGTDPFEMLPHNILKELSGKLTVQSYDDGAYVFKYGEPSRDALFIVASGSAEILVQDELGRESVVGFRRQYDFFGETVVLSRERYPGSARARNGLKCLIVPRSDLEELIYSYPEFSGFFNTLLAERMRLLYEKILNDQPPPASISLNKSLYSRKAADVMTVPVVSCVEDTPVADAAGLMTARQISSIVVVDAGSSPVGLLTAKDVVDRLIVRRTCPIEDCRAGQVMSRRLVQVGPEMYLGRVLVDMMKNRVKQVLVMERGRLVGLISLVDLFKDQNTAALLMMQDVDNKHSLDALAGAGREFDKLLQSLVDEQAGIKDILAISSEHHDRLTRRVIELCEEKMRQLGYGGPPVDYCWINMGSAARGEQTLRTDQDNAVIFADPPDGNIETIDRYFLKLAELIVESLDACGFEKCSGGVMASNSEWRRSLSQWTAAIGEWIESFDPESIRKLTILLDYRAVWGAMNLADEFHDRIFDLFKNADVTNHLLAGDDRHFKSPITILGSFAAEKSGPHKNEINLKSSGLAHIVNGMRILAVNSRIKSPSTLDRISAIKALGTLSPDDAEFFKTSFETLTMFKTKANLNKIRRNLPPDNHINPDALSKSERMLLKDAFTGVQVLQKRIQKTFSMPWMNFFR